MRLARTTREGRRQASRAADARAKLPVNSVLPAITGTAQEGETLSCSTGTWSNTPDAYAYQWNRSGSAIAGATSSTYDVDAADVDETLTCTVKATNLGVSRVATTAATATVIAAA